MPEVAATAAPLHRHRRTGVGRRTRKDPGDALGVLVVLRTRHRPARGDVGGVEAHHVGRGQVEADVHQFDAAAVTKRMNGFQTAEGDGQRGVHGGAADRPGVHVDATGNVDRHHRDRRRVDGREHLGGGGTQRTGAGYADDAVDHQIACRGHALHHPSAGLPKRGERLLVGAFGIEQHRGGGRAAATQECGRPQRVSAVVAGADDRTHRPARDSSGLHHQLAGDRVGQPVGRPPHQGTVGQRRQQRCFGFADRISGVVVPHR